MASFVARASRLRIPRAVIEDGFSALPEKWQAGRLPHKGSETPAPQGSPGISERMQKPPFGGFAPYA
jgi:hypothetical protein